MDKNPITDILGIIQEQGSKNNPPSMLLGKIIMPPPNIKIRINDIVLDKDDIYISEYLLVGYTRTAKGHIVSETQPRAGGSGDAQYASHTHTIDNDYKDNITYTDTLKTGDIVAVMPMYGSQQYIVLDKVVRL